VAGKNDEPVMCHRGFGDIRPNEDEDGLTDPETFVGITCPGCKKKYQVNNYFFYQCRVEIVYRKENDTTITKVPERRVTGEDIWKMGTSEQGATKLKYTSLLFKVARL